MHILHVCTFMQIFTGLKYEPRYKYFKLEMYREC